MPHHREFEHEKPKKASERESMDKLKDLASMIESSVKDQNLELKKEIKGLKDQIAKLMEGKGTHTDYDSIHQRLTEIKDGREDSRSIPPSHFQKNYSMKNPGHQHEPSQKPNYDDDPPKKSHRDHHYEHDLPERPHYDYNVPKKSHHEDDRSRKPHHDNDPTIKIHNDYDPTIKIHNDYDPPKRHHYDYDTPKKSISTVNHRFEDPKMTNNLSTADSKMIDYRHFYPKVIQDRSFDPKPFELKVGQSKTSVPNKSASPMKSAFDYHTELDKVRKLNTRLPKPLKLKKRTRGVKRRTRNGEEENSKREKLLK